MARKYWVCRKCGTRNERVKRKCAGCVTVSRPKPRVPHHARTLRDDGYEVYLQAAEDIHGVTDESCCVCGRPRGQERRHDRDHGHHKEELSYGKPRGLACVTCNRIMVRGLTYELSQQITDYLGRVDAFYRGRG